MQNRISVLRHAKGLSLSNLAEAVGTTKAQIQKLERGDRRLSLDWMDKVARALGVKMSDLLPSEEVACQHDAAEAAILGIISHLPESDKAILVQMASRLLDSVSSREERLVKSNARKTTSSVKPKSNKPSIRRR
jgi:transcriptional regulator with XRE-family HTH domain